MSTTALSRRHYYVAYAIGAFGLAMNAQSSFLVPLRARELGASYEVIGLLVGAGALVPALFSVVLGSFSDRLGPRRAFVMGTGLAALAAACFVFIDSYWVLLPMQLLLGGFRSLGWIASQSYITGIGEPGDRTKHAGRFSFFSNVGPMVGPLMTGAVAEFVGLRWAFLSIAVYALSFALMGLLLADVNRPDKSAPRKGGVGLRTALHLFTVRGMQIVLLLSGTRLWINWVWQAFFPVLLADAGVGPGLVGTVVFARALISTITAPTTGSWTRVMSKQTATAVGLGCGVIGVFVSPFVTSMPAAYISSAMVGVAIGVSLPLLLALTSEVVPDDQRGVALGLRTSVNQTAAASAPILLGPLIATLGAVAGFAISGGIAGVMVAAALVLHRGVVRDGSLREAGPQPPLPTDEAAPEARP